LEAASEKLEKSKRGRPRVKPREWDGFAIWAVQNKIRRTVIKRFYLAHALNVLLDAEGHDFGYLIGPNNIRSEILSELGQLEDDRMLEAAIAICEHKLMLKDKDAVAILRAWRTGKTTPGNSDAQAREIRIVFDRYCIRHPGTTSGQIRYALESVGLDFAVDQVDVVEDMGETWHDNDQ
jgi:hypothetical protein